MEQTDLRKELLTLLSKCELTRDEMLSVSVAVANPAHTEQLIDFLKNAEKPSADEIFQKAGEIAFGKNS